MSVMTNTVTYLYSAEEFNSSLNVCANLRLVGYHYLNTFGDVIQLCS